jgi:hypothetical protein
MLIVVLFVGVESSSFERQCERQRGETILGCRCERGASFRLRLFTKSKKSISIYSSVELSEEMESCSSAIVSGVVRLSAADSARLLFISLF